SRQDVINRLDDLLETYGGLGAYDREDHVSHHYLSSEFDQLSQMARLFPTIFLGVAAFLLNVVLSRLVSTQREQIAALKALGYSNRSIGLHYTQWALAITFLGAVIGLVAGTLLSRAMLGIYMEYFRFPVLEYEWSVVSLVAVIGVSLAASALGALGAVRTAVTLPPAEAMRPAAPASFRVSLVERLGLRRFLSQPARMIVRNLARRPLRALASITGIAFAAAIMVVGAAMMASIDELLEVQFNIAQRQDVTVSFFEPVERGAIHEVASLPGVLQLEPMRVVPARLRHGHRYKQVAIQGLEASPSLQRIIGADYRPVDLPSQGLVLSALLGEILDVEVGDTVEVEVLEGTRPHRSAVVAELVDDFLGTSAYMEIEALQRMVRQGETLSGAVMKVDSLQLERLYKRLKKMPFVAGVGLRRAQLENFQTYMGDNMGMVTAANLFFAFVIAFGVIYNTARISLSETSRELASLRVIGFTRREISAILLGELAVLTLAAIPLGLVLGYSMFVAAMQSLESELFRIPIVLSGDTFAMATVTVVASMVVSAAVVRRRLYNLDLIGVLKIRE
ncbi:MAG: ABC transporter permease, partial [Acidobacteria bacterium]|nr:ABC transporter permease [Acidobacteriota bacterium]